MDEKKIYICVKYEIGGCKEFSRVLDGLNYELKD
jgi:hypothetical protein